MSLEISPVILQGRQLIQSYGDKHFQISNKLYDQAVLVFPEETVPWSPIDVNQLTVDDFYKIVNAEPPIDLLLMGCGKSPWFQMPRLRDDLKNRDIVLELMDTGAACRTFNVLLGEDRRVAAALIPVD